MEALHALSLRPLAQFQPDTDQIRRNLIKKGVNPTPKIVHNLRKKQIQKHNRKLNRQAQESPPLSKTQKQTLEEEQHFQEIKHEYKQFTKALERNSEENKGLSLVGKPWEGVQKVGFLERTKEFQGVKLKRESLMELKEMFHARKMDELKWVFEDDLEIDEVWFDESSDRKKTSKRSEVQVVRFLVDRLCDREIGAKDWKFSRLMKLSGLPFTEGQLLMILEMLGVRACWKQALSVVQWVYDCKDRRKFQSRFVYTKLLAVLGKARRPQEALQIFNLMRGNIHVYPDMAAYHSIAVTLGQGGLLKELLNIVECMRQKPETFKYMYRKNWDPSIEPDLVIYNAVLNACVPSKQWKAVSWVFQQLRESGLKPNGATYGLAMEVMLQSGNYDLVHELFQKMRSSGEVPEALTYKVLVRTFWKEGEVDEAVKVAREMERRGVMGTASVYYELACCLCNCGRWQDAILEIKRLPLARPVEVTFTGMMRSSMDGSWTAPVSVPNLPCPLELFSQLMKKCLVIFCDSRRVKTLLECIMGTLKDKTVLLVTHQVDFLHNVDSIMVMHEGRVVQSGKYDELLKAVLDFGALVAAHESSMEILETSDNSNDDSSQSPKLVCIVSKEKESGDEKQSSQDQSKFDDKTAAKLIEDEGRETGHVSLKVYKQYFTEAFGWWGIALVVAMSAGWVLSFLAGDYWLAIATSDGSGIPSFTFIFVYASIVVVACIVLIGRAFMYTYLGLKTSQSFFVGMLQSILRAPMSFFDTTPSGRILSRVSTDILWVDITIPMFTNFVMIAYLSLFSILIVTCQNSWETVFLVIPLVWLYNWHRILK